MGKGTLGTWRFHQAARRSDTELAKADAAMERGYGQTAKVGANANQCLKPLPRWEGLWKKSQGFKPDPGNLAVRHYRGASGNVAMVEL